MLYPVNNSFIELIGDPHFGRKFIQGVPLERRGEREQSQLEDFTKLLYDLYKEGDLEIGLSSCVIRTVIIMGDLFDQFRVDNQVLMQVYQVLVKASTDNPDVDYIILQGNHDISRDVDIFSSLDILERMLIHKDNIIFVRSPMTHITREGDQIMLFPYEEFRTASEAVRTELELTTGKIEACFGHWDIDNFGDDHNLVPLQELTKVCSSIVTGHIHSPETRFYDKDLKITKPWSQESICNLLVVGSLQPYSHAEDPDNLRYITLTLDQLEKFDPKVLKNKCVRVLLKPGETLPDIDCLQLSFKNVGEDLVEETEVQMEVFSFKQLFDETLEEQGLTSDETQKVWDKYQEINRDAQDA